MSGSVRYPPAPAGEPTLPGRGLQVSVLLLVLANLVPVVGVLTDAITLGDVFLVYWAENVVVGVFTVVRIVSARGAASGEQGLTASSGPGAWFLAVFFCVHFGIFTVVHGAFTVVLVSMVSGWGEVSPRAVALTLLALVLSHGYSLGMHWFRRGERGRTSPQQAMGAPYPRMIVLHLSILGSFFLLVAGGPEGMGDPFAGAPSRADVLLPVLLLTTLKLGVDLVFHLRAHRDAAPAPARAVHPSTSA